jgi:hypothetical protein
MKAVSNRNVEISIDLDSKTVIPGFNVPPLPGPNFNYVGPGLGNDNACLCSSVFYSLLSACSLCQSARYYRYVNPSTY